MVKCLLSYCYKQGKKKKKTTKKSVCRDGTNYSPGTQNAEAGGL